MPYEKDFHTEVHKTLGYEYGVENIEHEVYLESERFVDFVVDTGVFKVAIEVETDVNNIAQAIGQAILYSSHREDWMGAVIYPASTTSDELKYVTSAVGFYPVEWEALDSEE